MADYSARYKTLRHIETVRNYLQAVVCVLFGRAIAHDQCKLESPEAEVFDVVTHKLRGMTYGSDEYKTCLSEMDPALVHHYAASRHHPEHFKGGIQDMNLVDLVEMLCDWKAATMRHADGDIYKSIEMNQKRYGYSDETKAFLNNTAVLLDSLDVVHKANES